MRISLPAACKPALFYLVAALPVLLPLLAPAYVLVLDMVFAPAIPMPQELTNTFPFYALLHFLNILVPAWIIQKLLLVSIFAGAGVGAFTLLRSLEPTDQSKKTTKAWLVASHIAGIFYMYNPFVYTRLMAGQYLVLAGYALLPFFARAMWMFVSKPDTKSSLRVAGLTTAIAITSVHTLVVAVVLAIVILGVKFFGREGRMQWKRVCSYGLAVLGAAMLLNSFWLVPVVKGTSSLGITVANFSQQDFAAFATVPGDLGIIGNILALQGFWGDEKNLYLLPQDLYSWWLLPIVLLWVLVAAGAIWSWRHRRSLFVVSAVSGIIGLMLAAGTAGSIFAPFNQWLAAHLPLYAGYREPQKAAALLVLAYAYFVACGSFWLVQSLKQETGRQIAVAACLLLSLACAPLLAWGGRGQLHAQDYPRDWYTLNQALNTKRQPDDKALFLPWHLYQPFTFSSGTVATPAEAFFDIPVISSKDPELDGASPYKNGSLTKQVDELLGEATKGQQSRQQAARMHLPGRLASQGVRYILVSKNYDYKKYDFLSGAKGVTLVSDSPTLIVYRIAP